MTNDFSNEVCILFWSKRVSKKGPELKTQICPWLKTLTRERVWSIVLKYDRPSCYKVDRATYHCLGFRQLWLFQHWSSLKTVGHARKPSKMSRHFRNDFSPIYVVCHLGQLRAYPLELIKLAYGHEFNQMQVDTMRNRIWRTEF